MKGVRALDSRVLGNDGSRFPGRDRGVATLLIVVMLGLVVTAAAFGSYHVLSGAQERQLAVHSTAPAQATAWRGVQLVRRYLEAVDGDVIADWGREGAPLAIGGDLGITARITEVVEVPGSAMVGPYYRVTAQVSGMAARGTPAQSTSLVEVVYRVVPGDGGGPTPPPPGGGGVIHAMDIHRNLDLTGSIQFRGPDNAVINVDGNARLDSASITGIDTLRATGEVSIGSNIQVGAVHANGNVELTGSSGVGEIRSRGDVTIRGGSSPMTVRANGRVHFAGGNGSVVESRGAVRVSAGGVIITSIATEGDVDWSGSGGRAGTIHANGNIRYNGGKSGAAPTLRSRGNITATAAGAGLAHANGQVRGEGWGRFDTVAARGGLTLTGSFSAGTVRPRDTVEPVVAVSIPEVPEVQMPAYRIDVYPLRAAANYVFEYVGNRIQVQVSQVAGIPDGTYVLGERQDGRKDWLCRPGDLRNGVCQRPVATICQGFSEYNACFTHDRGKWTVNGTSMARGVAWFDGDLQVGNGTYVNTFLATGNLNTSGNHRTVSPNYAGYAAACRNAAPAGTRLGVYSHFAELVPTNLCDVGNGTMTGEPLGNIAYLAGGLAPGGGFVGGDIDLGASTRADGAVMAGNLLRTGGSTTLNGRIVSAAQRAGASDEIRMGGSTTMDLGSGSDDYDPSAPIPCMVDCEPEPEPGEPVEGNTAKVQWSRYL